MSFIYNIKCMLENDVHPLSSNIVINYDRIYNSVKIIIAV
nr:hypothetical protein TDPV-244 [Oriental turtle dovepox virus]